MGIVDLHSVHKDGMNQLQHAGNGTQEIALEDYCSLYDFINMAVVRLGNGYTFPDTANNTYNFKTNEFNISAKHIQVPFQRNLKMTKY